MRCGGHIEPEGVCEISCSEYTGEGSVLVDVYSSSSDGDAYFGTVAK